MPAKLCEHCKKNNATIYLNETVNGKSRSLSLCPDCAAKLRESGELPVFGGLLTPFAGSFSWEEDPLSLTDAFFGGLFSPAAGLAPGRGSATRKTCPVCGATPEDFRRTGRLGCPTCYRTFAAELDRTIRSIHGDGRHVGRTPKKPSAEPAAPADASATATETQTAAPSPLDALRDELARAIEREDYESAIRLRDEIRRKENENGESAGKE